SERVGRQIRVDGQHKKDNQQRGGDPLAHVTREREAEKQKQRAERIDDVVYIEPIARTLSISVSRQRSVQAVAKPVEKYEDIHDVKHQRIVLARGIARTGPDHTY